jgi:methionine sulfoxide reductase catalytic subunit
MFNILKRPDWNLPEGLITPESAYLNRRSFLRQMGFSGAGLAIAGLSACSKEQAANGAPAAGVSPVATNSASAAASVKSGKYPADRNPEFNPNWVLTKEAVANRYNNFYEFTTDKAGVHQLTGRFTIAPWPIEIGGLVEKPMKLDVEELIDQMTLEERIYRFRCVEAWAMVVPWTGFPLQKLLAKVVPKPEAKFIKFVTFNRPEQAPGMRDLNYPWPYTEGLRLDEAMNPLTLVGTGLYGKPLPKQHGAPIRIVVPWKYGYKSIKSIVKIELVAEQPKTLWETLAPHEYPFESNVDPAIPHPRWQQSTERMIDTGIRVRTLPFNGYGDFVAKLYRK